MKHMLLSDMASIIENAFFLNAHDHESTVKNTLQDYSEEIAHDLSVLPEAIRVDYEAEYRKLFRVWLNTHSNCEDPFVTGDYSLSVKKIKKRKLAADARYWEFRKWREQTLAAHAPARPGRKWPWA